MFEYLLDTYKLQPCDVFMGNKCIYSNMIMGVKGKEKENEAFLEKKLYDVLEIEDE